MTTQLNPMLAAIQLHNPNNVGNAYRHLARKSG